MRITLIDKEIKLGDYQNRAKIKKLKINLK